MAKPLSACFRTKKKCEAGLIYGQPDVFLPVITTSNFKIRSKSGMQNNAQEAFNALLESEAELVFKVLLLFLRI